MLYNTGSTVVFGLFVLFRARANTSAGPSVLAGAMDSARFLTLTSATVVFSTLMTFGLMFRYQPQTTPTRAALVYLTEPLFATAYAWIAADRAIDTGAILGAVLIIMGNVVAEVFSRTKADKVAEAIL